VAHGEAVCLCGEEGTQKTHRGDAESAENVVVNGLTEKIIGTAIEVHKVLGPGLLESAYEECLAHELRLANISFERQVPLPVSYKSLQLDCGYRLDFLVERTVVLELKAVEDLQPIHQAQLLTYLKLGGWPIGLLINFNVSVLKKGIKRLVHNFEVISAASVLCGGRNSETHRGGAEGAE
jgi:GxxExxY protein